MNRNYWLWHKTTARACQRGLSVGLILVSVACMLTPASAACPPALPEVFSAIITNASDGAEKCLIFSNNGNDKYPSRHNWGNGPFCGFPGGKGPLLKNKQAVWTFTLLDKNTNAYLITNASDGAEKCLIFSNNGRDLHPSRHNWGSGSYCGFPGGKDNLLDNGQAIWILTWLDDTRYMITNASDCAERCLIFSNNGKDRHPSRHNWGCKPYCGFPGGKERLLDNKQAVWNIRLLDPPPAGVASNCLIDTGQSLGDGDSYDVALGDLDGDNDIDAFVANGDDRPSTVWLNNGAGVFSPSGQNLGNTRELAVELGDVDGDNDLDAMTPYPGGMRLWLNNGKGRFTDSGQTMPGGGGVWRDVKLGDLDGDGDLDALVSAYLGPEQVWLNNGKGTFTVGVELANANYDCCVSLGDLDGDNDLDAVITGEQGDRVFLNSGAGAFGPPTKLNSARSFAWSVLGDLDGDCDLDLFNSFRIAQGHVWINNGHAVFSQGGKVNQGENRRTVLGDINGDGHQDALVMTVWAIKLYLNNGAGAFTLGQEIKLDKGGMAGDLGDLDGDGDLDAFVVLRNKEPNRVFLGQAGETKTSKCPR